MGALATAFQAISDAITDNTALKLSPTTINARTVPNSGTNGTFSIDMQTTNSNKGRDRASIRLEHSVKISVLWRRKLNNQLQSALDSLDIEETVLDALMNQSNLPGLSVFYVGANRSLIGSEEYKLIEISFKIAQEIAITS